MRRSGAQGGCSRPGTGDGEYGRAALAPPSLFAFFEVGLREAPMTVAEMQELFAYNAWANRRCFAALESLPAEAYFRDLKSSHGGLHGTLCHIVWGEQLWLNRWLGKPNPAVPQGRDLTTLAAARTRWEAIEAERAAFLAGLGERRLRSEEHTSELQSPCNLVCRLLLEKKKKKTK